MKYKLYEGIENNIVERIENAIKLDKKEGCIYSIFWGNNNEIYSTDRGSTVEEIRKNPRISESKKAEMRTKNPFVDVKSAINDLKKLERVSTPITNSERILENIKKIYSLKFNEEETKAYLDEVTRVTGISHEDEDSEYIKTDMGMAAHIISKLFDNFKDVQWHLEEDFSGIQIQKRLVLKIDEDMLKQEKFPEELTLQEKKQIAEEEYKAQGIKITELEATLTQLKADREKTGNEIAGFEEKE